jgi:energy-converting hydrogenase Eha subunit F
MTLSENRKERASAMLCLGLSVLFIALIVIGFAIRPNNIPPGPLPEPYGMVWDTVGLVSFLLLASTIVLSLIVLRKPRDAA